MDAPREEEIVHLAGDRGMSSSMMTGTPTVTLSYRGKHRGENSEKRVTCEVYEKEDGTLLVSTLCVRCSQGLSISSERKRIDFDRERGLFIEPFECTWEFDGDRRIAGLSLCRARVAYDGKTVRDA